MTRHFLKKQILFRYKIFVNSRIVGFIYCLKVVIVFTCLVRLWTCHSLVAFGLDDEAAASQHFGGGGSRDFPTIPIE